MDTQSDGGDRLAPDSTSSSISEERERIRRPRIHGLLDVFRVLLADRGFLSPLGETVLLVVVGGLIAMFAVMLQVLGARRRHLQAARGD